MKRNPDFLLKDVAGKQVLVPVGKAAAAFPGMITVNSTGKFIWEFLAQPHSFEEVVEAMTRQYEVTAETAQKDAQVFIDRLRTVKAIID